MGERFDIPSEPFSELRPVAFRATPQSFPGQEFLFEFEWNNARQSYVFSITHLNRGDGFVVLKSALTIRRTYSYQPFLDFFFSDPTDVAETITPDNLGDTVFLYAIPGPEGASVETWDRKPEWFHE